MAAVFFFRFVGRILTMEDGLVKNTLAFRFPPGAPAPTLVDIARFVKNLDADLDSMETSYKLAEERCVCVKFKSLDDMKEAQSQIPEIVFFRYSNGEKVEVKTTVAGCCTKYVRIFDLPPEVPDSEIAAVLGRYGVVKRMIREKFPADLGLNMFTGVRGVYLDIKKVVPASLYFLNRKGRIFYEGLKQKCFLCREEGHLKADCPQRENSKGVKSVPVNHVLGESSVSSPALPGESDCEKVSVASTPSYSGVLTGAKPKVAEEKLVPKMVTLVSERNKSPARETSVERCASVENIEMESETDADDVVKSGVKRQHSTGGSAGETDEDGATAFTKAHGNRKSSRTAKKSMTPLETIASVPLSQRKGNRSSSK